MVGGHHDGLRIRRKRPKETMKIDSVAISFDNVSFLMC